MGRAPQNQNSLERRRRWRKRLVALADMLAGLILVAGIGVWAIMGRVCSPAKPPPAQKGPVPAFFRGMPRVLNIAHRGASENAPEHTLEAYDLALRHGADVLELDVRMTGDGVLVAAHDATLKRTLGLEVAIADLSYEQLSKRAGERRPLRLDDVIAHFPGVRFNLELKDESIEAARALARVIEATRAASRVLVASAHDDVMAEFRRNAGPQVATSASMGEALRFHFCHLVGRSCSMPFVALQLPPLRWLGLTRPEFLRSAHEAGLVVHYWTIDGERAQRRLIEAGADGIMTNRPAQLSQVLATREKR